MRLKRVMTGGLLLVLLGGAACGYALRSSKTPSRLQAKGIHRIYVHPIENATLRAGVENTVFNALVRAISTAPGIRTVPSIELADAELFGSVGSVERSVTSQIKATDLNPKGLGSPNILVATEYQATLSCEFRLKSRPRTGAASEQIWSGAFSRARPFPGNNQLWTLGSTSALINESEFDRTIGDVAEQMSVDVLQSLLEEI